MAADLLFGFEPDAAADSVGAGAGAGLDSFDEGIGRAGADLSPEADPADALSPRHTAGLEGHADQERKILADFLSGRMPHALILSGAPGIGKATFAFRLARFLFSQSAAGSGATTQARLFGADEPALAPASLYVAPDDPVFRRVASGGHSDLLTIGREYDDAKGRFRPQVQVDAVRRITPFLRMTAGEGGWRVVIIDDADTMNRESQNALLKILEEPPARTMLLLVASRPGRFLPTIRSRCRVLHFQPLTDAEVQAIITPFTTDIAESERRVLTRMAEGSPGRALRLYQDGGIAMYAEMISAFAPVPDFDHAFVHALAERLGGRGADSLFSNTMDLFVWWLERLIRSQARGEMPAIIVEEDRQMALRFLAAFGRGGLTALWQAVRDQLALVHEASLDRRLAVLRIFSLCSARTPPELQTR